MASNRFATFADPDEVATAAAKVTEVKKTQPKPDKKVVIKAKETAPAVTGGDDGFEQVGDRPATRGGERGSRGGPRRGGDRGGRGRGGDRPETAGDRPETAGPRGERSERGERGSRGGRGRGRGRGAPRVEGEGGAAAEGEGTGPVNDRPKETGEKRFHKYTGKAREEAHPYDRKSGTGRGKRDMQKEGHGKGNWGKDTEPAKEEVTAATEEEKTEEKPAVEEKKVEEEVIEYVETGVLLDDYLASKNTKGLLAAAAPGRKHENVNTKGVEVGAEGKRITTINSNLRTDQVYAPKNDANALLFRFQAKEDTTFEDGDRRRGGGRGDREPRERGGNRGGRGGRNAGGKKPVFDDNAFPAL